MSPETYDLLRRLFSDYEDGAEKPSLFEVALRVDPESPLPLGPDFAAEVHRLLVETEREGILTLSSWMLEEGRLVLRAVFPPGSGVARLAARLSPPFAQEPEGVRLVPAHRAAGDEAEFRRRLDLRTCPGGRTVHLRPHPSAA